MLLQMAVPLCLSAQQGAALRAGPGSVQSAPARGSGAAPSLQKLRLPGLRCTRMEIRGAPGAAFLFPAVLRCRWVFLCLQHTALFDLFQDLPSFTQNVHRLVNDLRYYRLCNDSLPPGTVKL